MVARTLVVMIAAAALAGCLDNPLGASDLPSVGPPGPVPFYGYLCPGASGAPTAEPCLTSIAKDDATLQEPFAAIHPMNPDVMAIGVNYGPAFAERVTGAPTGESHVCEMGVYFTEDAGRTWRETFAPIPEPKALPTGPTPNQCAGDPAFVFSPDGTLHLTGIYSVGMETDLAHTATGEERSFLTYYTRTADFGATWTDAIVLSESTPAQDRNWISREPATGALYVIWQNTAGNFPEWTSELAWSADEGATWRTMAAGDRPVCHTAGPVAFDAGRILFTCSRVGEDDQEIAQLFRFDPATGKAALVSEHEDDGFWPHVTVLGNATMALKYDTFQGTKLAWSRDGGANWSAGGFMADLLEGEWSYAESYWTAGDGKGGYHAILRAVGNDAPVSTPLGPNLYTYELRHLVLDAAGEKRQDALLSRWTSRDPPTPRLAQGLGDHYYGLDFASDRGLLAVTRDAAIQVGLLSPLTEAP